MEAMRAARAMVCRPIAVRLARWSQFPAGAPEPPNNRYKAEELHRARGTETA
jgi:hypothetical protein